MPVAPYWTDVIGAVTSVVTATILLAAGLIAWWQASEARKLRRAQARPFVVIDFDLEERPFIHVRIWNAGTTMARNVRFDFTPELETTLERREGAPHLTELPILQDRILSLPPGKEIRFLFDNGPPRHQSKLPDTYSVRITYEGETVRRLFRKPLREKFTDETTLDLSIYWGLRAIVRHDVHDMNERLKEISSTLKRWTASGGGLLALDPQDVRRRDEEWIATVRQQEEQREAEDNT
jgi:hypothetical protein